MNIIILDSWKIEENQTEENWNEENLFWNNHEQKRRTVSHFKEDEELFKEVLRKINKSIISRGEVIFEQLKLRSHLK